MKDINHGFTKEASGWLKDGDTWRKDGDPQN